MIQTIPNLEPGSGGDALLVTAAAAAVAAVDDVAEPHDGDVARVGVALARHLQRLALLRRDVLRLLGDHGAASHHNLPERERDHQSRIGHSCRYLRSKARE